MANRPEWILLRGLAREAAHWGDFPAQLAARLGHTVRTVDLPGAGVLHDGTWPGSVAAAADDVRRRAGAPDGPRYLLGISLGGMVAMQWAANDPSLAGVVVGASSARGLSPFWRRMRLGALWGTVRANLARDVRSREAAILRQVCNRTELHAELTERWTAIQQARPMSRRTLRGQLWSASRWRAPKALLAPALFLVGDGDRLVDPACSQALATHFGAPLRRHPSAGHDLSNDAGPWIEDEIEAWLTTTTHE